MNLTRFKKLPVMGILRGIPDYSLEPLLETIEISGLRTIEFAMNTRNAPDLIRGAVKLSGGRLMIGAGTVLDLETLKTALDSGATFIVTPVLVREVADYCVKNKIPVFPGAFCPKEIYEAWCAGATMVKVFPVKFLGPEYFREIKGPFEDIELMACSGVTPENIRSYFENGASAVAVGSSVFRKDWIEVNNYDEITKRLRQYLQNLPEEFQG